MAKQLRIVSPSEDEDLSQLPDEELVELCQHQLPHELRAYRELVKRYETMVYNICMKISVIKIVKIVKITLIFLPMTQNMYYSLPLFPNI
ncbi:MAG: hypothetical protein ACPG32_11650, partial [Akkermansiaceae bacterium]